MATTRFSKGTRPNAQIFVLKAINETAQTTYAAFVQNAAVGEFGVFNSDTLAKITAAISGATKFFIAQKLTGATRKSTEITFSTQLASSRKVLYSAPVKCKMFLGWTGTGGALNLAATPSVNKNYEFAVIDTTEGNEPFPTFNYGYTAKATDAEIDVVQGLAKQINDASNIVYRSIKPLVTAKVKANATYSNFTLGGTTPTATFTKGSTLVTLGGTTPAFNGAIGDSLSVDAAATPDVSIGDLYKITAVSAAVSFTLNRPYTGATQTFTQAEVQGTRIKKAATFVNTGLELTCINNFENFKLAVREELINADRTFSAYNRGSGASDQILDWEDIGTTFAGETTKNTQFADKFGKSDRFTVSGETYDYYHLDVKKDTNMINTFSSGQAPSHVAVIVPKSAGSQATYMNTLFGL